MTMIAVAKALAAEALIQPSRDCFDSTGSHNLPGVAATAPILVGIAWVNQRD
jgi:hypothetical protein